MKLFAEARTRKTKGPGPRAQAPGPGPQAIRFPKGPIGKGGGRGQQLHKKVPGRGTNLVGGGGEEGLGEIPGTTNYIHFAPHVRRKVRVSLTFLKIVTFCARRQTKDHQKVYFFPVSFV